MEVIIEVLEEGRISAEEPSFCVFCNPIKGPPGEQG